MQEIGIKLAGYAKGEKHGRYEALYEARCAMANLHVYAGDTRRSVDDVPNYQQLVELRDVIAIIDDLARRP